MALGTIIILLIVFEMSYAVFIVLQYALTAGYTFLGHKIQVKQGYELEKTELEINSDGFTQI